MSVQKTAQNVVPPHLRPKTAALGAESSLVADIAPLAAVWAGVFASRAVVRKVKDVWVASRAEAQASAPEAPAEQVRPRLSSLAGDWLNAAGNALVGYALQERRGVVGPSAPAPEPKIEAPPAAAPSAPVKGPELPTPEEVELQQAVFKSFVQARVRGDTTDPVAPEALRETDEAFLQAWNHKQAGTPRTKAEAREMLRKDAVAIGEFLGEQNAEVFWQAFEALGGRERKGSPGEESLDLTASFQDRVQRALVALSSLEQPPESKKGKLQVVKAVEILVAEKTLLKDHGHWR